MKARLIALVILIAAGVCIALVAKDAFKGGVGNPLHKALNGQQQQKN